MDIFFKALCCLFARKCGILVIPLTPKVFFYLDQIIPLLYSHVFSVNTITFCYKDKL